MGVGSEVARRTKKLSPYGHLWYNQAIYYYLHLLFFYLLLIIYIYLIPNLTTFSYFYLPYLQLCPSLMYVVFLRTLSHSCLRHFLRGHEIE